MLYTTYVDREFYCTHSSIMADFPTDIGVMNHGIIGKKVIMISKKTSIRVLVWEILII